MSCVLRRIRHSEKKDKKAFLMRNGKIFLEKLIASGNGKRNPIHGYCSEELGTATDNYGREKFITSGPGFKLYKGFLQNRYISVMKFEDFAYANEFCFNNIVFASQMSHKNLLRLLGCCLETQTPILVFESIECGSLADRIYQPHFVPLPFTHRLKVAMEIANAIAYLHVGFSRPILFRHVAPSAILFDENNVPKLFDFSLCESIPDGETHTKVDLVGAKGFVAPEYLTTNNCNEKCDVYSFGMLLLVLLTGQRVYYPSARRVDVEEFYLLYHVKKYFENNRLNEIIDPIIIREDCPGKEHRLQAFLEVAFECVSESVENRPTMVEIAKQLRRIYLST